MPSRNVILFKFYTEGPNTTNSNLLINVTKIFDVDKKNASSSTQLFQALFDGVNTHGHTKFNLNVLSGNMKLESIMTSNIEKF